MHGRKKTSLTANEVEIQEKKKNAYMSLTKIIFGKRIDFDSSKEVLELSSKLIRSNPDVYSIWNIRREMLINKFSEIGLDHNIPSVRISEVNGGEIRDVELTLTSDGINKNPKSYCAWYHRQWVIDRFAIDVAKELQLCQTLLQLDQRNFHCWNYRRYLVTSRNIDPNTEFQFSLTKIEENFSNYSAFHHRSVYLSNIATGRDYKTIVDTEFSIIENAIFTEPDDQSAWWYYQFLLRWILASKCSFDTDFDDWFRDILQRQLQQIDTLLEVENNNKWAMATLVSLLELKLKHVASNGEDRASDEMRIKSLLTRLQYLDPIHKNRYQYLMTTLLLA